MLSCVGLGSVWLGLVVFRSVELRFGRSVALSSVKFCSVPLGLVMLS